MTDILDEAINDYKEEKKLKRLKRFLVIVFISTLIGIVYLVFHGYSTNKSRQYIQKYTGILLNLVTSNIGLDDTKYNEQIEILINQKDTKIKELSLFDIESKYVNNQDIEKAIKKLDLIISGEYYKNSRNLALISKFGIILDKAQKDSLNEGDKKFIDYFYNQFLDENEIFYEKALLYMSLWYINQGDVDKARELLDKIKTSKNCSQFDKANVDCILNNLLVKN
jgi:hypothetical protein